MDVNSWSGGLCERAKPFVAVISLQFGYSGMSIISKFALNKGTSQHVLVVYRNSIAFLAIAPFALIFDRPTIDQNLYYAGMNYTTATFTAAMYNILPAFAFILAWIFRYRNTGPMLDLPWTKPEDFNQEASTSSSNVQNPMKGAIMIIVGCVCWAGFIILQANTLKSYPTDLSLTALICLMGAIESTVFALFMEHGNSSAWAIKFDYALLAAVYSGVISTGIAYFVQGVIMKSKGPVFVTAFNPLSIVIVAIISSFLLAEIMYLGRIIGAIVIVIGIYLVLWGKSKDHQRTQISNNQDQSVLVALDHVTIDRPHESV
ncbi:hypothetical protein QYF36_024325 [Acer negundo]|nr:hypothetical protein QYF36_024325 [Acer negundo]